jgi:membrane protease YdiL (CAAX protease family)
MASHHPLLGGLAEPAPEPLASTRHLRRLIYIVFGIALVMSLQARSAAPATTAPSRIPMYLSLVAIEFVFVWFVAIGIRARGLTLSNLLGRRWRTLLDGFVDAGLAIATVVFLRLLGPLLHHLLGGWRSNAGFLLPTTVAESVVWVIVSAAAGICEELVFRGYLQGQLWGLTKNLPAALLLQALIFGIGHIYQGWKPALVTALYGLVFGLVAAWRRSVIPGAIAHAVIDVMGGFRL